jgi:hypothetical protein
VNLGGYRSCTVSISALLLHPLLNSCGAVSLSIHFNSILRGWSIYPFHIHNFKNNPLPTLKSKRAIVKMHTSILALSTLLTLSSAFPQRNRNGNGATRGGGGRQQQATAQQQAAQVPQGLSQATDGSVIMDDTVMVKYALTPPNSYPQSPPTIATSTNLHPAASQSASKSLPPPTNSSPPPAFRARPPPPAKAH